jgi:hypothetical protein
MVVEHPLDLRRVDVEAVDQDQLTDAGHQDQVAVAVREGDVPGGPPPVGVGPAVTVRPVAGEQVRAADDDLAGVGTGDIGDGEIQLGQVSSGEGEPSCHSTVPSVSRSRSDTPGSGRPIETALARSLDRRRGEHRSGFGPAVPVQQVVPVARVKRAASAGSSGAAPQTGGPQARR